MTNTQDADRERESQLDAMRATLKRLVAENEELRNARPDSAYTAWNELVRASGAQMFADFELTHADALLNIHSMRKVYGNRKRTGGKASKKRTGGRACKKPCGCPAMQPHRKGCGYLRTPAGVREACRCKGAHSARCKARQLRAGVVLRKPGT